ncbi:MAG: hypothetical protein GF365_01975 [Candidatus Buchananbacteria bacterium]|nr:hypothetical protein [Candidatus Buchananbacteria bacterium]
MCEKIDHCVHLAEFLQTQRIILQRHIDEHKWCRQIADDQRGKEDFIKEFGWLMREIFCGFACPDRQNCKIAERFLPPETK